MLHDSRENGSINIDCVDPLGRTALLMAIDNENLEMVEVLLENKVETKDALLHAINEEFVEAVEVLLDHEESIHQEGEPWVRKGHYKAFCQDCDYRVGKLCQQTQPPSPQTLLRSSSPPTRTIMKL